MLDLRDLEQLTAFADHGTLSGAAQALHISQPTLSHHMKILCDCGLVCARREGKWTHYSLCGETLEAFRTFLNGFSGCEKEECCQCQ